MPDVIHVCCWLMSIVLSQVFVLDRRQFGTKDLINEKLAGIQGPAFLAYNDAVFSDADWKAIRTVSQSSKTADNEFVALFPGTLCRSVVADGV